MMESEAGWLNGGGSLFHKSKLCDMEWSVERGREARRLMLLRRVSSSPAMSSMRQEESKLREPRDLVAAQPFGGGVAILSFDDYKRDVGQAPEFSPHQQNSSNTLELDLEQDDENFDNGIEDDWSEARLRVYSSTGKLLKKCDWYEGPVAPGGFGWCRGGLLLVILAGGDSLIVIRGLVDSCAAEGEGVTQVGKPESRVVRIPTRGSDIGRRIACAHVWEGGFVAITHDLQVVEGLDLFKTASYRVRVRAQLSPVLLGDEIPRCISVLRPMFNVENAESAQICIANPSRAGVIVVEPDGQLRSQFANDDSRIAASHILVPHPTLGLVASYGMDGSLSVLPLDFYQVLAKYDCQGELERTSADAWRGIRLPASVQWCGTSTFALAAMWSHDTPWSSKRDAGLLVLSLEDKGPLLSKALMYGSSAVDSIREPSVTGRDATSSSSISSKSSVGSNRSLNGGSDAQSDAGEPLLNSSFSAGSFSPQKKLASRASAGRCARFAFKGRCVAFHEPDGIRVVGVDASCMVRQVPGCFQALFRLGSTDPAAMLLDALEMVENGDSDADAGLRALVEGDKIGAAVETCLDAAEHATCEGPTQTHLLRVASYGKRFFHLSRSGQSFKARARLARRFVNSCKTCAVVANVRRHAGFALTTKQLRVLTPRVQIDRLLYQGHYFLAQKLCDAATVSRVHVITHWASAKIRAHSVNTAAAKAQGESGEAMDKALVEEIVRRVDRCYEDHGVRVPFASIAAVAAAVGNRDLALLLGTKERKLSRRVLLYLQIQDYERALRAVCDPDTATGVDPDLLMFVASECANGLPLEEITRLCRSSSFNFILFSRFFEWTDRNAFKRLLLDLDKKKEKAKVLSKESQRAFDARKRIALMRESAEEFKRAGKPQLSALAQDQAALLERQHEVSDSLVGLSLANTVLDCIRRGMDDEAENFAARFGLNDRIYRKIQLRGLAARKAWTRIEELSYQQAVRAVLDDADFAEAFMKGGRKEEAKRHLVMLEDSNEKKAELMLVLGMFEEALEAAFLIGNIGALEQICKRCPELASQGKAKLEQLRKEGPKIKVLGNGKGKSTANIVNQARETCAQQ